MDEKLMFEKKLQMFVKINQAIEGIEAIPTAEVKRLVFSDRLRRQKKRELREKMVYSEDAREVKEPEILRMRRILLIREIKELGCMTCEEKHPACLEFHHEDSEAKSFSIASHINRALTLKDLSNEINKCILICSNCHRKEHHRQDENA